MTLTEYKKSKNLTYRELTAELKNVDARFTTATVHSMLHGIVETPDSVKAFLASKQIEAEETPLSDAEESVLWALKGHSRDNPLTRSDLRYKSGLRDRIARLAIESLRSRGYWIINGEEKGYYITQSKSELEAWLKTYTARAKAIHKTAAAMRAGEPYQVGIGERA